MEEIVKELKKQEILIEIILMRVNRIYAHIECDWDALGDKELSNRYRDIESMCKELFEQDIVMMSKEKSVLVREPD